MRGDILPGQENPYSTEGGCVGLTSAEMATGTGRDVLDVSDAVMMKLI